jgi:uncharacterized membrane protein
MKKNFQRQDNRNSLILQKSESFSGPLPHPDLLLKFDEVVPGAAERILKLAETQSAHRIELERMVVSSDISRSKWGQILGFILAVIGLTASVVIGIFGSALGGGIMGATTVASLVGVFMYGSRARNKERRENKES